MRAFTGATVWVGDGSVVDDATLVVEDGAVVSLDSSAPPDAAETVDCSGRILLPGFVDAHAHTGISGDAMPGDSDTNETSEAITPYTRTLDAIFPGEVGFDDARRGGVTTLGITHGSANPIGGQLTVLKAAGSVVDDMVIRFPAGIKMALGENPKRVGDRNNRAPLSRMGSAYLARKAFIEALEYRRDWEHHEQRVAAEERKPEEERAPIRPPKRDLGKEALLLVLDREIPVRNHAHRMDDIRTAIRLAEEFGYRLVIDHATEAWRIPEELASRGIPVAVGPLNTSRYKHEIAHRTPATAGIMHAHGVEVSIMTDSPVNPIHTLRDLVILAIREGLPEDQALQTVTINPARLLGVDDRVGTLEPGKDADFIVFDGDPWDGRNKVRQTYIDGTLVHESDGPYLPRVGTHP